MVYDFLMYLRNWCFDHGLLKQQKVELPVISVGNLSMGGTGKTPMVELIVEELRSRGHRPCVVSRGYGRKTKGPLMATPASTSADIGDEPFQMYRSLNCPVIVAEKRLKAIPLIKAWNLQNTNDAITCIVLDDAYQHRFIRRDCNILLTDYHRLFTRDRVLPWGSLREPRCGAGRADIIIVTKCPENLSKSESDRIIKEIGPELHQQVYFATIAYDELPDTITKAHEGVTLITGIANPQPILEYLQEQGIKIKSHYCFSDHHTFSCKEIEQFRSIDGKILTTAKDAARLPQMPNLYVIRIHTKIIR